MSITDRKTVRFRELISEFNHIKVNTLSGNLVIQVVDIPSWMLCFSSGQLAGISGGIDAIERWERNLALASLNVPIDRLVKSNNHQEIFLNSNKIAQECAIKEVLFDIIQFSQNQGDRLAYRFIPISERNSQVKSVLPLLDLKPLLSETIQSWREWDRVGLASCAPSLFPIVQNSEGVVKSSDRNLHFLLTSIDGITSLRSLAIHHQQQLIDVAKSIFPLITDGTITLSIFKQSTLDRADTPIGQTYSELDAVEIALPKDTISTDEISIPKMPLIACVDDSLSVYKLLEKIIIEHGYRSFGVQNPLKIIPSLIRNKPDLVFLDLVMPITNGYEVCEQIRKTPSLANVPIIILTGNDGLIDRVRTKFVGANGFLGKPIDAKAITKTIDKYLAKKQLNPTVDRPTKSIRLAKSDRDVNSANASSDIKRVLVIDDDLNIREVVSMCLHKLKGWDVQTVSSGQEGLNNIQIQHPDAIVLDVMMPEMDGLAFLRQLRADRNTKMIPVILLTANRYLPDRDLLTELGVVEIVSKPFLPIDLVRQIDRALEGNACLI
ncbi:response regulator [Chamaesiphon sp. GL140_3_metabinner_50]|uniref:response regulator n=1 Tax=Chamaesiphon sp. GL140_3_metabinner_50 TaxID=2970812 RepID=UPI0025DBA4DA|nr:response regulator [Chamaesiphon sp. GL140_3_metabinner_50]